MPQTLYDKIWNEHVVHQQDDGTALLYVDRHLIHEVTSPQAFEGLRLSKRQVRKPNLTLAVADHNVPTTNRSKGIKDQESKIQVEELEKNCKEFGIELFDMKDKRQGIVHIIGPEQGFTQPGTIIVCGDSHTATHGAFGSLAFGIGTSEVEHVLATQTLVQKKAKNFRINVNGQLPLGVTSKDVILQIIGKIGTAGGTGSVIEYAGDLIRSLSLDYSIWMIILPFFASFCYQFDGIFIGASQTKEIRNAMFFSVSLYLLISLVLTNYISNHGVWISLTIFMILRALSLYFYLNRIYLRFNDS